MYWENIEGICDFQNIYSEMVGKFNNAVFVEIGTWKGKSAMYMAEQIKGSKKNIKFYTIDIYMYTEEHNRRGVRFAENTSFFDEVAKNLEPLKDYVTMLQGRSQDLYTQFEDNSIDFIFMDGNHDYEDVKEDIRKWFPKVKKGGYIGGHDYCEPSCGVKKAVDELLFSPLPNKSSFIYQKMFQEFIK